jgi:hypothetical protein
VLLTETRGVRPAIWVEFTPANSPTPSPKITTIPVGSSIKIDGYEWIKVKNSTTTSNGEPCALMLCKYPFIDNQFNYALDFSHCDYSQSYVQPAFTEWLNRNKYTIPTIMSIGLVANNFTDTSISSAVGESLTSANGYTDNVMFALSKNEADILTTAQRYHHYVLFYCGDWWLRTPFGDPYWGIIRYDGTWSGKTINGTTYQGLSLIRAGIWVKQ